MRYWRRRRCGKRLGGGRLLRRQGGGEGGGKFLSSRAHLPGRALLLSGQNRSGQDFVSNGCHRGQGGLRREDGQERQAEREA